METEYKYYNLNSVEQIRYYMLVAGGSVSVGFVYYNNLLFSLILFPIFSITLKKYYVIFLQQKRHHLFLDQFIDLLHSLAASFGTGRQMKAALEEGLILQKATYKEDSPMVQELDYLVSCIKESREGEDKLLFSMAKRSNIKDFQNFVEVYAICKETGGDMEKAVASTSRIIIEKISLERDLVVLSAQKKLEGRLISLMPVFIILFLKMASPSYIEPLYSTLSGRLLMTLALILTCLAYYATDKITRLVVV